METSNRNRDTQTALLSLFAFVALGACKGDAPAKKIVDGPLMYKTIESLDVEIQLPDNAPFEDSSLKEKYDHKTVLANPSVTVIGKSGEPKTDIAAAKKSLQESENFQEFTKEEAGPDGSFHLEYSIKKSGKVLYGFHLRKKVGEKFFNCGTNGRRSAPHQEDEVRRAKAVKVCQSLRAPQ